MRYVKKSLTGLALCLILAASMINFSLCSAADLIDNQDWQHLAGAIVTDAGIEIIPVGRMIVPKVSVPEETDDEGVTERANLPSIPNPPINLRGPLLQVEGSFSISTVMDVNPQKGAYLYLYGTLPIIYDEWRQEGKTLRLGLKNGELLVAVWDGQSSKPITRKFGANLTGPVTVILTSTGNTFGFQVNGEYLGQMADPGIFRNGEIRFGADAELGGGFIIRQLSAQSLGTAKLKVATSELPTYAVAADSLRALAASRAQPVYIGAAAAAIPLATDARYQALVGREFSMITPENDMKFQFIHPQPDMFVFQEADILVEFAERNNIRVHGHALVWHEALPAWVTDIERSPEEVRQVLSEHIRTITGRYKGKVAEWDVVNEPLRDIGYETNHGLRSANPWFQALGESYIDFAFREANAIDPDARLYLNEYGIEEPGEKFDALYALVQRLLARGVPIHGIGFQMHEDMERGGYIGSEPELVAINMQKIAALGLEVRISEMDVNLNGKPSWRRLNEQAHAFSNMLAMSLGQTGFRSFGQWGVTDRYSSLTPIFEYSEVGNGLLFDVDYQPKPAYFKIKQILMDKN